MVVKIKHYLVDSENVNDNWLMLLDMAGENDEIIIFYTKNSPHMAYSSVIKLLQENRTIQFKECFEGQNALDFQLISYLGYLIGTDESEAPEFIVMSNDTGFDPAVRFWKKQGFLVNRINVNYCKLGLQRQKEELVPDSEEELPFAASASEEDSSLPAQAVTETSSEKSESPKKSVNSRASKKSANSETSKKPEISEDFNKEEVDTFINCFGKNNLVALHETFVHVYGQEQGQLIYKTVKDDSYSFTAEAYSHQDKIKHFTDIIFAHSDMKEPGNFVSFLDNNKDKTRNLNGIRASIVKAYGKDNGMKYYSLFKPYFKMISALK